MARVKEIAVTAEWILDTIEGCTDLWDDGRTELVGVRVEPFSRTVLLDITRPEFEDISEGAPWPRVAVRKSHRQHSSPRVTKNG